MVGCEQHLVWNTFLFSCNRKMFGLIRFDLVGLKGGLDGQIWWESRNWRRHPHGSHKCSKIQVNMWLHQAEFWSNQNIFLIKLIRIFLIWLKCFCEVYANTDDLGAFQLGFSHFVNDSKKQNSPLTVNSFWPFISSNFFSFSHEISKKEKTFTLHCFFFSSSTLSLFTFPISSHTTRNHLTMQPPSLSPLRSHDNIFLWLLWPDSTFRFPWLVFTSVSWGQKGMCCRGTESASHVQTCQLHFLFFLLIV